MQEFNPREHLINIKSRQGSSEYLPVQWRLVWFRGECPEGSIETEVVHLDLDKETEEETFVWNSEKRRSESVMKTARGIAIFRATVKDGKGGIATGIGSEKAASFGDYIEKAETKAIGRALAALGFGTQFAPELEEMPRIVDSPVDFPRVSGHSDEGTNGNGRMPATAQNSKARPAAPPQERAQNARPTTPQVSAQVSAQPPDGPVLDSHPGSATKQQLASIKKLEETLKRTPLDHPEQLSQLAAAKALQTMTVEYRHLQQQRRASEQPTS